jgi:hypothetical protein
MKHNLAALVIFLLGSVVIFRFRFKWMKGIIDNSKIIIEATASRLVLDLVLLSIIVWKYVQIPDGFLGLRGKYLEVGLQTVFMMVIVGADFALRGILRWKFLPPKGSKRGDSPGSKVV